MKQRQKSRKTSSRLANDHYPAATSNHNKQPYREGRSYLQLSDKVVRTTYEAHQDPRAEGESLQCRTQSKGREASAGASLSHAQNRMALDKKRSCQQLSEYLAGSNRKLLLNSQQSHSAIPGLLYVQRKYGKKKQKNTTPNKPAKQKRSTVTLKKESKLIEVPPTATSNRPQINSSKLLRSVRDFSLLTHSHRSIEKTVKPEQQSLSKVYVQDGGHQKVTIRRDQQPYLHRDALLSMYNRTSQLLESYSSRCKHLLKINKHLSKELASIKQSPRLQQPSEASASVQNT